MPLKNKFLYIFLLTHIIFQSCEFTDSVSFNPAFIELSKPELSTVSGQGDGVLKVQEVFVYVDGVLLGVFPLPATVPVIVKSSGQSEVRISAAIKVNGAQTTSLEYPFFAPIEKNMTLEEGRKYQIPLTFSYTPAAKFDFAEGFEGGNLFNVDLDGDTNTSLTTTSLDASSGGKSGLFRNSALRFQTEVTHSTQLYRADNAGGRVFLEMDYKSSDPIAVGTILYTGNSTTKNYKITLKPSAEWNRIYIEFTDEISSQDILAYRICLFSYYEGNSDDERNTFVDNVKLIHF